MGLTVALTGPTGDIGKSVVRALEREDSVERIVGMARRPFDPADHGWTRAEYRLVDTMRLGGRLRSIGKLLGSLPGVAPVLPDPGVPFQLVHHDDVADALVAAATGRGEPGAYNLAADDQLSISQLARALGWRSVP